MQAEGAAVGRKPWRYYYVMAFPLDSGVTQDKLQEVTEMTAAIEQREEEYLHKVEKRNAARVATLEAQRRAAEERGKPTMALHVTWVLRRLHVVSAVLLLLMVGVLYVMFMKDDGRDHVPQKLVKAVMMFVVLLLVVNAGGWISAYRGSVKGARVLLVIDVALVVGLAFLLDEMKLVQASHKNLRNAIAGSKDSLTQDAIDSILNGGMVPSLVQRFVFDAPSVFLHWLREHCAGKANVTQGYASVAIDRREFFSPMWNDSEKFCIASALRRGIQIDEAIVPMLTGELVMVALQVLFTSLFLAVCDPLVDRNKLKRRRQRSLRKPKAVTTNSPASISTALTRLLTVGTALFGSSNAIASMDLLHACSIADFRAFFTWILVVCLVSGLSAMLAALLVGCRWKQQLAGALLVLAVAGEVFMLAEFVKTAAELIGPGMASESDHAQVQTLREVYVKASGQTCWSIQHWISHICVGMAAGETPADFDLSCQHEFVALLLASFNFTDSYMALSIGLKLVLLLQIILPALRQAVRNVVSYVCCVSSRDNSGVTAVERSPQESSPSINYEKAVAAYLRSFRTKDCARIDAERNAFEKEWSARTRKKLSDVRTPRIVVTAHDFGAIVRTLMLRRLTAICKLDLSLSVSADGQLLLVRIFASDNLLLATLCEKETYRLQFADAVDPGRAFWRDRKEVNADQKVLDAHTVKHKLKLLLAENAMSPKEAVWFSGESLARVSARVHALSRISRACRGLIRCCNPAPAFASYSPNIQRQFIYKKYLNRLDIPDTYRRSAVLRTVDCIRLTRLIIDAEFDTSASITSGLVSDFHCLHSSSRYDWNSRATLASSWITFWRPIQLPGEFEPDKHAILNLIGRLAPFRQPLQSVRDYFGEVVAFYFAWLVFYAKMMILPTIAAVIVVASPAQHSLVAEFWGFYTSPHNTHTDNPNVSERVDKTGAILSIPELVLGSVVIAWSFVLIKLWDRRSVWCQLQWGVAAGDTIDEAARFDFDDDCASEQKPSICYDVASLQRKLSAWLRVLVKLWDRRSVWCQLQWGVARGDTIDEAAHFDFDDDCDSEQKPSICSDVASLQRKLSAWLCVLALAGANLVAVLLMLLAQGMLVDSVGEKLAILASCLCQAYLVQWNGAFIPSVAHALSRWENPECSSGHFTHRKSVVTKIFALQLFNAFSGLIVLMLSGVGGLAVFVHFVAPLRPLYVSYNARIEGHVGIFVQMESLLIALFVAQLSIRILLIVSAIRRFRAVCREEQRHNGRVSEDETSLSPYPGPHKDYVQIVMQLGLVVMFSSVCPLLPILALVDCAVKLRQNALELCCIRQRPEPEMTQGHGSNGDCIGLGLWAPFVCLMLKMSVPIALAVVFFTADNYDSTSIERRVGWWLIGVVSIWLVGQLLWVVIPHESRQAEEARARTSFLVDRYFGQGEVDERKAPPGGESRSKHFKKGDMNLRDPAPSAEEVLLHYEDRLKLLQRLNVALPKRREELGGSISLAAAQLVVPVAASENIDLETEQSTEAVEVHATEENKEERYVVDSKDAEVTSGEGEVLRWASESSEEMIVGYFRPVQGTWPPQQQQQQQETLEEKALISSVDPIEAPPQRPPRRGSVFPETLPIADLKISESNDEGVTGSRVESGSEAVTAGRPAPMRLSKLFKRIPPSPSFEAPALDDIAASELQPQVSPFMSAQIDFDPEVFAPSAEELAVETTELEVGESTDSAVLTPIELGPGENAELAVGGGTKSVTEVGNGEDFQRVSSRELELLEEKKEVPVSSGVQVAIAATAPPGGVGVASSERRFSPRLSFLARRAKPPASTHSGDESNMVSQADAGDRTLLRQLSPRLSFLTRKSQRSSSKSSESEDSKVEDSSNAVKPRHSPNLPDQPAPRRLSKLFKRIQPTSSTVTPLLGPPQPQPVAPEASTFDRIETEDRAVNPVISLRDQFDFLSDARSESVVVQTSLPAQRRRSSRSRVQPPSPPPVYERVDLSGLEAVREAASRRQFDFSADEQVWKQ